MNEKLEKLERLLEDGALAEELEGCSFAEIQQKLAGYGISLTKDEWLSLGKDAQNATKICELGECDLEEVSGGRRNDMEQNGYNFGKNTIKFIKWLLGKM